MQFDKNAIASLLALDDAALWNKVRALGAASGISLPETITPEEAATLRRGVTLAAESGINPESIRDALARFGRR